MTPVFLDTSGLIAVVNTDDQWHEPAAAGRRALIDSNRQLITSSYVLVEIGDGLSRVHQRALAMSLFDRLRASPRVEIVAATAELEAQAWDLVRRRMDKDRGITDCATFVLMQQRGIQAAFTLDHHFQQAGFRSLLLA